MTWVLLLLGAGAGLVVVVRSDIDQLNVLGASDGLEALDAFTGVIGPGIADEARSAGTKRASLTASCGPKPSPGSTSRT